MRLGQARLQFHGPPMSLRGLLELAQLLAGPPQQIPSLGPAGVEPEGLPKGPLRPREITGKDEPQALGKCRVDLRHDPAPWFRCPVIRRPHKVSSVGVRSIGLGRPPGLTPPRLPQVRTRASQKLIRLIISETLADAHADPVTSQGLKK